MGDAKKPDSASQSFIQNREDISHLIGAVTLLWNSAHGQIFRLFYKVSGMPKPMAEAVFFSLRSDASQRGIARAVCRESPLMDQAWKDEVDSSFSKIDLKSGERNAVIHTIWDLNLLLLGTVEKSRDISPDLHHKKLETDIIAQLKTLLVDSAKFNAYFQLSLKKWDDAQALRQTHA